MMRTFLIILSTAKFCRVFSECFVILSQSLGKAGITVVLLKSAIFYVAVTLEAFIFCFAGEYLSDKVCVHNILFHILRSFSLQIKLCPASQFNLHESHFTEKHSIAVLNS